VDRPNRKDSYKVISLSAGLLDNTLNKVFSERCSPPVHSSVKFVKLANDGITASGPYRKACNSAWDCVVA
jgi:hypothetical protein